MSDLAVSKFDASGGDLLWSTFLGGSNVDCTVGCGLAVDGAGTVYVTGSTRSPDFPTTAGAFDTTFSGPSDAFVAKLASSGGSLLYSTFVGGADVESAFGVEVDGGGAAYATGNTHSADFPTTTGAFDTTLAGGSDVFVIKIDPSGGSLAFSTFLGGTENDTGFAVRADPNGAAYVAGLTGSADFPTTPGAFDQSHNGDDDAFVTKLEPLGGSLVYSTFLGGADSDHGRDLRVEGGSAHVTGGTESAEFPTTAGSFDQTRNGGSDAFVTRLDTSGSSLLFSTFLGGSAGDEGRGIALDGSGGSVVTGATGSADFPIAAAFDTTLGGPGDAFVSRLDPNGGTLTRSTYLGGSANDFASAVTTTSQSAWVVGSTTSEDFPTTRRAFEKRINGKGTLDAFFSEPTVQ